MAAAYLQLLQEQQVRGGASTACVGVFRSAGALEAAKYAAPRPPRPPR